MKVRILARLDDGTPRCPPLHAAIVLDLACVPLPGDLIYLKPLGGFKVSTRFLLPVGEREYVAEISTEPKSVAVMSEKPHMTLSEVLREHGWEG